MEVRLEGIELRSLRMPLAEAFRSAHSTRTHRDVVLVRAVVADGPAGWAELVAESEPTYWPEYTAGAWHVLRHHLVPRLLDASLKISGPYGAVFLQRTGDRSTDSLDEVRGHQMAKAALRLAVLDAGLRAEGHSLASDLGATRREVPTGIALGMTDTVDDLVAAAVGWWKQGHRALKLKIAPGWDVEPLRAVRDAVHDEVALALVADANGSYRSDDRDHMTTLGQLVSGGPGSGGLAALEQPFAPDDLTGHAVLAARGPVPVCLDESVGSLGDLDTALTLGACGAVNLKVGRVGGVDEALRIHQRCVEEGVPVRAGGMLETGVGRAVNLAVAALPGCTLPPDLGPSDRYFSRDITPPHVAHGGTMTVPGGPGLGVEPIQEVLDEVTTDQLLLTAPS